MPRSLTDSVVRCEVGSGFVVRVSPFFVVINAFGNYEWIEAKDFLVKNSKG
jgi:hypothetical protein